MKKKGHMGVKRLFVLIMSFLLIPTLASAFTLSGNTLVVNGNTYFDWGSQYGYVTNFDTYVQLLFQNTTNLSGDEFGIYGFSTNNGNTVIGDKLAIFNGATDPGSGVKLIWDSPTQVTNLASGLTANIGKNFGFYLQTPNGTFYSQTALNGGADYFKLFNVVQPASNDLGPNDIIVAIDDGTGDSSNNGITIGSDNILPSPTPEPGTLLLFGVGLVGLAFYRQRRKA
jgi:hypothetical protein